MRLEPQAPEICHKVIDGNFQAVKNYFANGGQCPAPTNFVIIHMGYEYFYEASFFALSILASQYEIAEFLLTQNIYPKRSETWVLEDLAGVEWLAKKAVCQIVDHFTAQGQAQDLNLGTPVTNIVQERNDLAADFTGLFLSLGQPKIEPNDHRAQSWYKLQGQWSKIGPKVLKCIDELDAQTLQKIDNTLQKGRPKISKL